MKDFTNKQIDAGLELAGTNINEVKGLFKAFFPEASEIIESKRPPSASVRIAAVTLWFGFKAGVMVGVDRK